MQLVNPTKKSFLMKDRVGTVRASTYNLPTDPTYVYGHPATKDPEGCGDSK